MPYLAHTRRVSYYSLVLLGAVAVHQAMVMDALGPAAADLARRNSEAYAMMLLIPLWWDLFASSVHPGGRAGAHRTGASWTGHVTWFVVMSIVLAALQSGLLEAIGWRLPQAIITLGEAFLAAIVVSAYLGWSRSLFPGLHEVDGTATVGVWPRRGYYMAVLAVAAIAQQSVLAEVAGATVSEWFQVQTEAYAAMVIIPLYFDLVACSRRGIVRAVWYPLLVAIPVLVQTGALDGHLPESLLVWIGRTTESFIAGFVISIYFDVWRQPRPRDHRSPQSLNAAAGSPPVQDSGSSANRTDISRA